MSEKKEMRAVLAETLMEMMAKDERICVLDADLAKASGTIKIRDTYPDRAFDVGIAEANMTSVAAGLASYGFVPFITSFTPFATRRNCDQIAISVCYANNNVKIVGTDPGLSAELNGGTHMSVEDCGVLRSIPNMVIYEAVDAQQLKQALPQIVAYDGPVYIRLFRKVIDDVFSENYKFDLFKADVYKAGKDVSIFATGIMMQESVKALELLKAEGIDAELINLHTIKPLDEDAIVASVKKTGCAVVAENHNVLGGLSAAVAQVTSEKCPVPLRYVGIQDRFGQVGKLPELMREYSMTAEDIVNAAKSAITAKK